jgi:hypothetical protein
MQINSSNYARPIIAAAKAALLQQRIVAVAAAEAIKRPVAAK